LAQIAGTGMGGRVTRKDVMQFLERGAPAAPPAAAVATSPPVQPAALAQAAPPAPAAPAVAAAAPAPAAPSPAGPAVGAVAGEDEEVLRPSATRLTIARNMERSALNVPVAWMVVEVDVTGLVQLRERYREAFRQREGVDLTYLPFVIQALVG